MDDLAGLDWNSPANPPQKSSTPSFSTLRPSPAPSASGRSTPSAFRPPATSSQPSLKIGSKPGTPANDSFASLLSGGQPKATNNLSLQERQRQLLAEKAKKAQQIDSHFGVHSPVGWNATGSSNGSLGRFPPSQSSTPQPPSRPISTDQNKRSEDDDILAAFNSTAKVDTASHFPPQQFSSSRTSTPATHAPKTAPTGSLDFMEDDDPFGLSQLPTKSAPGPPPAPTDDDDILGMLGRPAQEVVAMSRPKAAEPAPLAESDEEDDLPMSATDKAVAELVDMGFPANKAAIALAQTESSTDVQAAVGILLQQAHEESRQKTRAKNGDHASTDRQAGDQGTDTTSSRRRPVDESVPSWIRNEDGSRSSSRSRGQGANKEKDVTQYASEIGSSLFKSANSFWKTGQKKVQKAMSELQQEGESSQPKWMRDAQLAEASSKTVSSKSAVAARNRVDATDEALRLESSNGRPTPPNRSTGGRQTPRQDPIDVLSAKSNPFEQRARASQVAEPFGEQPSRAASRLTRQESEHDNSEVYISPARRRKPQPPPPSSLIAEPSPPVPPRKKSPLASSPAQPNNPFLNVSQKPPRTTSSPTPVRPKAPPRQIPPVSSAALSTSASHRQTGSEAFKRGDFASAHTWYTSALQPLPASHPITIMILCNRALTNIKVGDPKAAIADAESALGVIGISKGDGEKISLGPGEGEKEMKEFYGKALMRKAEALENTEKWSDAAKAWREAVEAGVGGSISIQGRNRCEKASGGGQQSQSSTPRQQTPMPSKPKPKPRISALDDLAGKRPAVSHAASAEAVRKLRAANAAAERADDEKFALTDQVDAKLIAWKGTKADNLRALLGSLDKVLWEEAGWKKVGMQDLIMVNRVKIIYMKAIAKVHPDKISQTATTEQKMLSAAVFSTLNEAWDKFKKENNM